MTLESARSAIEAAGEVVEAMGKGLATWVEVGGRLSRDKLDGAQPEAFELARSLAEVTAAGELLAYAERVGSVFEQDLARIYAAIATKNVSERAFFGRSAYGLTAEFLEHLFGHRPFVEDTLATANLVRVAKTLEARGSEPTGAYALDDEHDEIRRLFARFADERVAPLAEHIHRHDAIIPEDLLREYVEMGVFGISIPDTYGGSYIDHLSMVLTTEELSRGSVGAGGSVITRPEICAKAVLKGGTEAQKQYWLPRLAQGEEFVSVAVTEPNAGSDVASLRVTATKTEGGYLINGEKTWCTFAGRASVFLLLARTGSADDGHKGLTMFLVPKEPKISADDHHAFRYVQPQGGVVEGHAIPTLGYRGMHSFSVTFEDYFVAEDNRIGDEGQGFYLQMEGFAGGRIQTAARAVGLMEAAFRAALAYARDRKVFGKPLVAYSMTLAKLARMAATIQASRQLSYRVARLMDEGQGAMEASLVKLMSCKDAEWVSREAMQLHGGMGYSEEYAVSRYFADARVLSIFEGAEEVLALYVVARPYLSERIGIEH